MARSGYTFPFEVEAAIVARLKAFLEPSTPPDPPGPPVFRVVLDHEPDELAGDVELPDVIIPNRLRPGWAVRYSVEIDNDELKRWRDKATERKKKLSAVAPSVDDLRFACLAMAALCRVIIHDDVELYDGDRPVTFGHPRIWRLYDAQRAADAVRRFYGSDPYLMATFDALCAQAGVGEDVEPLDPTRPSAD